MSIISKALKAKQIEQASAMDLESFTTGTAQMTPELAAAIVKGSVEDLQNLGHDLESSSDSFRSLFEGKDVNDQQLDAGLLVTAMSKEVADGGSLTMANFGSFDPSLEAHGQKDLSGMNQSIHKPSLEAFTPTQATKFTQESVVFAMETAKQVAWAEAIFPTEVVEPNSFGYSMMIPLESILTNDKHDSVGGKSITRRRAIDAYFDSSMLADTKIKLYQISSSDTASVLSTQTGVAKTVKVFGTELTTKPIVLGKTVDLLALTANEALVGSQVLDITDDISRDLRLKTIYLTITNSAAEPVTAVVPVEVLGHTSAQFGPGHQGDVDRLYANFDSTIALHGTTKTVTGEDINTVLGVDFAGGTINVDITMNASVNVSTGVLSPVSGSVGLNSYKDSAGDVTELATLTDELFVNGTTAIDSFYLDGTRTNSTHRSKGIQMDTQLIKHPMPIGFGAPLTEVYPLNQNARYGLERLVKLAKVASAGSAMKQLVTWFDHVSASSGIESSTEVHGAAAAWVTPYAAEVEVDLSNFITNDMSNRAEGAMAAIVGKVHTALADAVRQSGIMSAYSYVLGDVKPKAVMLTRSDVASLLMTPGDEATLGALLEPVVVTNDFTELDGAESDSAYIYCVLTNDEEGVNPLKFGNHYMMPSLITDIPTSRGQSHMKELTATPRYRHYSHVPVIVRVLVKNINSALTATV